MLRWAVLVPLLAMLGFSHLPSPDAPPVKSGQFVQAALADWLQGTLTGVYVEGAELRLQTGQTSGTYQSRAFQAPFGLNAATLEWHALVTSGQTLTLELRSSVDGQAWTDWQSAATATDTAGKTMSQLFVLHPFTSWLQYRAHFAGVGGSPALANVTLTYLSSTAGPALVDIVGRVPPGGPLVKTPPPATVAALDWGAVGLAGAVERQTPQRIRLSEVPAPADDPNSAATLRALQWVALNLQHEDTLPYHFLLDGSGTIYQGPGSASVKLPQSSDGTVEIALLATVEREGLSEAAQASLASLLGWLGDAYGLDPNGLQIAPNAPSQLIRLAPDLRAAMDRAIVRSRLYFAAGNTALGTERLSVLNRGPDEARATLTGISALGQDRRSVVVPAGKRVDVTLNSTFPVSGPLGVELLADRQIEAERIQIVGRELLGGPAASQQARVWYFADASGAEAKASAVELLNPQDREATATVTLFPDASGSVSHTLTLAARSRQTVDLDKWLPGQHFALSVVSAEPIVAERLMVSSSGAATIVSGSASLSRRWMFAEGSTMAGYTTTLTLFNPWPQQLPVTLRVMSEDGTSLDRRYAVPGLKRTVLTLNDIAPDLPFSMDLTADRPIAVERLIQFDRGAGASAAPGALRPATRWDFVEGSTAKPAGEFLLVLNPNNQQVGVDVEYLRADGRRERHSHTVGAAARLTVSVNAEIPDQPILSARVTADRPVVAERTIYVNGVGGRGGETSLGIPGQ